MLSSLNCDDGSDETTMAVTVATDIDVAPHLIKYYNILLVIIIILAVVC